MTSFQAIGLNVLASASISVLSLGAFGVAMIERSSLIAPRCSARPRNTIYNPSARGIKGHPQNQGSPFWGWIRFANSLSYAKLLRGVPGTGTRKGGLSGLPLKVNMDGIVLLRFQALCLRIIALSMILNIFVILPTNVTGYCRHAMDDGNRYGCFHEIYNHTSDYDYTTLANIPNIYNRTSYWETVVDPRNSLILGRLYAIVFCTWIITYVACRRMHEEWKILLAMRRVYYLEKDHFKSRKEELKSTVLEEFDSEAEDADDLALRNNRFDWIPHPEQRETVINVDLYSVSVTGIPSAPHEEVHPDDLGSIMNDDAEKRKLDWQLEFATEYFDRCVQNPPGYSSAIAAVTIMPSANSLSLTWSQWYCAAGKLRRLNFVRRVIARKEFEAKAQGKADIEVRFGDESKDRADEGKKENKKDDTDGGEEEEKEESQQEEEEEDQFDPESLDAPPARQGIKRSAYRSESIRNIAYNYEVLGFSSSLRKRSHITEIEEEEEEFLLLDVGPEQVAMYSREFAQSASTCCPHGCLEELVWFKSLEELREMEIELHDDLQREIKRLRSIQHDAYSHRNISEEIKEDLENDRDVYLTGDEAYQSIHRMSVDESLEMNFPSGKGIVGADSHQSEGEEERESRKKVFVRQASIGPSPSHTNRRPGPIRHASSSADWAAVQEIFLATTNRKRTEDGTGDHLVFPGFWRGKKKEEEEDKNEKRNEEVRHAIENAAAQTADTTRETTKKVLSQTTRAVKTVGKEVKQAGGTLKEVVADPLSRQSTTAVVTFLNRQSAVAARQCLADGRGQEKWVVSHDLPVAPMAQAPPFNIFFCRGCCRPVSTNIHPRQKLFRKFLARGMLFAIYAFYTIPIGIASQFLLPENLEECCIEGYQKFLDENRFWNAILGGFVPGLILTTFFALCPVIFKAIANFGSNANSIYFAEYSAMQYFWYFYVVAAFTGNSVANAIIAGFRTGSFGAEFTQVLREIADTVPTQISATWLNWVIVRSFVLIPVNYMLQLNSFLFQWLGWRCCSRMNRGGGPGGPIPYRIYIDSGLVFLCNVGLAPAAPLMSIACYVYFLICTPIIKRNLVYVYRPNYDSGGGRWPFLFNMLMTSIFIGQIVLLMMMILKTAYGPAAFAIAPFVPCFIFRLTMLSSYGKAYKDASLFHTSELDGLDPAKETSAEDREEFRKFLVDAHKAAYVPICFAQPKKYEDRSAVFTSEPSVVVPTIAETSKGLGSGDHQPTSPQHQKGATLRRVSNVFLRHPTLADVAERLEDQPNDSEEETKVDGTHEKFA